MLSLAFKIIGSLWEVPSEKCKGFASSQYIKESFTLLFLHQKWQGFVMELGCMPLQVFILIYSEKSSYLQRYLSCSLKTATAIDESNQILNYIAVKNGVVQKHFASLKKKN